MSVDWHDVERLMERADAAEARLDKLEGKGKVAVAPKAVPAATAPDATVTALPVGG